MYYIYVDDYWFFEVFLYIKNVLVKINFNLFSFYKERVKEVF